mmetsp:Transcript_46524/g.135518  ORF Transcript_46524/g.135518 Transcript_46524/m.135518 type:complete len:203 (-) Transcript_46524:1483-2091(-)
MATPAAPSVMSFFERAEPRKLFNFCRCSMAVAQSFSSFFSASSLDSTFAIFMAGLSCSSSVTVPGKAGRASGRRLEPDELPGGNGGCELPAVLSFKLRLHWNRTKARFLHFSMAHLASSLRLRRISMGAAGMQRSSSRIRASASPTTWLTASMYMPGLTTNCHFFCAICRWFHWSSGPFGVIFLIFRSCFFNEVSNSGGSTA